MRLGDKRIFNDHQLLYRVVNLRLNGYASTSLAIIFNCHRSSIESQLSKYAIRPVGPVFTIERIASDALHHLVAPEPRWINVEGQNVSMGKSYKDYLRESKQRRIIRIS